MNTNPVEQSGSAKVLTASPAPISVKKKKRNLSVLLLIFSLIGAVALWLFVVRDNNTVSAVTVSVTGNERLMGENLSVSLIEPQTVDIVLRGKSDQIKQILSDKSIISAKVNIFKTSQTSGNNENYIFEDESAAKVGVYTVKLEVTLPEGVSCAERTVTVTVSETLSKKIPTKDIGHKITNYSFSSDCSLGSMTFEQQYLTISGDVSSVNRIASVAVVSDWSKEITGDITVGGLVPIAYDDEGDVIDSRFLRFEPSVLQLNISVNKVRNVSLALLTEEGDHTVYSLSQNDMTVFGPVKLIDRLGDVFYINKSDFESGNRTVADSYELRPEQVANSVSGGALYSDQVRFTDLGGNEVSFIRISVRKDDSKKTVTVVVPAGKWSILTDGGFEYSVGEDYPVTVTYIPKEKDVPSADDLVCFADLRGKGEGVYMQTPVIAVKNVEKYYEIEIAPLDPLSVGIIAAHPEPTPASETSDAQLEPDGG
ncbi:MAG: hypothetical protein IJU52_02280 [Clostridia bacterium]|nr:hypothetical protein [Clostridia bacterium]